MGVDAMRDGDREFLAYVQRHRVIGYGRMMQIISHEWYRECRRNDDPVSGVLVASECLGMLPKHKQDAFARMARYEERGHVTTTTDRNTTMAGTIQTALRETCRRGVSDTEAGAIVTAITAAGYRIVASGKPRCDGWMRDRDTEYRVYDGGNGQWEWERIVAGGVVAEGIVAADSVADALKLAWEWE